MLSGFVHQTEKVPQRNPIEMSLFWGLHIFSTGQPGRSSCYWEAFVHIQGVCNLFTLARGVFLGHVCELKSGTHPFNAYFFREENIPTTRSFVTTIQEPILIPA